MLTQKMLDDFEHYMRAAGCHESDIAWLLKRIGVPSTRDLTPDQCNWLMRFASQRRKYGRNLVEQWEKFNQ
jgi:hypothetical protein